MSEQRLVIRGMSCAACQVHVQQALERVPGVTSAAVDLLSNSAVVTSGRQVDEESLASAVRAAGYDVAGGGDAPMDDEGGSRLGLRAVLALVAGAVAMLFSMPLMTDGTAAGPLLRPLSQAMMRWMPHAFLALPAGPLRVGLAVLAVAVMLFAAPEVYVSAWRTRRSGGNMNTLVARGTLAAFAMSLSATVSPAAFARRGVATDVYYEAVILILAFLLAGRWLEARARRRATDSLRAFAALEPASARLLDVPPGDGLDDYINVAETVLPVDAVAAEDLLRVLPGERIPVDGVIVQGRSSINESMLTGEPLPVTRASGESVSAGTLNLDGVLVLRATAVGARSTLAQIRQLLVQAQSGRAPMQRLADRVSAVFVPAVTWLAVATFVVWLIAGNTRGGHAEFVPALSAAISVVIVACPCAMGLAVPAAVTVAIGRAAQMGLLIKGGEALEHLAAVDTVALDKTGTVTEGHPRVVRDIPAPDSAGTDSLAQAAAVERFSTHPIAAAIVRYAEQERVRFESFRVDDFELLPGMGARGVIAGHTVAVGSDALLTPEESARAGDALAGSEAKTAAHIVIDGRWVRTLLLDDSVRSEAGAALAALRKRGLSLVLITGDRASTAETVATQTGIAAVRASCTPAGKVEAIRELQRAGHRVAMAGDGINDAAALAAADAGIAMAGGTDLAREAGDVLLLHADLRLLPTAFDLARNARRVMRQNLGWALGYNVIALPVAAGVFYPRFHLLLTPVIASAAMALSSVSVLANSLRLRRFRGAR